MTAAPMSDVLQSLAGLDQDRVPVRSVVAAVGTRVHGTALLLLVLPDTVPLPIPSASSILGVPLLMIAAHLALFGERSALPARVQNVSLPKKTFQFLARYLSPVLRRLERVSRPRWPAVAEKERFIGLVCAYLSLILLFPLPLMNTPPAIALALISWGIIQKDGVVIAAGIIATVLLTAGLLITAFWLSGA